MKRAGNLMPQIADLNNLYHAYWKASRTKTHKPEVQKYAKALNNNIIELKNQLLTGQLEIGNYNYFTIYDPKKRVICAASFPERVLHHAIMNVCHPYFENYQISDSYATRLHKGTYKALDRAAYFSFHYKYYLKLDVRKYFDTIDHTILKTQLRKEFKDNNLLQILFAIIDSYTTQPAKGLPIGNLTSQYFANHYLSNFDHYIKETLKITAYVRYMDDMIIWSNSAEELINFARIFEIYLKENLSLSFKICYQNTTAHGLNFLSYRIFDTHIELARKSKTRFLKKIEEYNANLNEGTWLQSDYQRHTLPLLSFTNHASAKGFRRKVFHNFGK